MITMMKITKTVTFLHVFDNTAQGAVTSSAILSITLNNIYILRPDVKKYTSDLKMVVASFNL